MAKFCGRLYGGGYKLAPDHTTLVTGYIFAHLRRIAFKFDSFTNFKAPFSVVRRRIFPNWLMSKGVFSKGRRQGKQIRFLKFTAINYIRLRGISFKYFIDKAED